MIRTSARAVLPRLRRDDVCPVLKVLRFSFEPCIIFGIGRIPACVETRAPERLSHRTMVFQNLILVVPSVRGRGIRVTVAEGDSSLQQGGKRRLAVVLIVIAIALALVGTATYLTQPRIGPSPGPSAPLPPTNVLAVIVDGGITISWDPAAGAQSYHLYRASLPGVTKAGYAAMPDGTRHANVVSPYTIAGLAEGKTYYIRVTAGNPAGESEVSGEVSATLVVPPSNLSPPTTVVATPGEGRITISWDAVAGAVAYHVYRASVPGVTKDGYAALPDGARHQNVIAPYTVAGLMNGRAYYFRVTAENGAGESDVSGEVSATPLAPPEQVNLHVTGLVELDNGAPAADASVTLRLEDGEGLAVGRTGADGRFTIGMTATFPDRVLAEVMYRGAVGPPATGFRFSPLLNTGGAVDVGRILLPEATDKRMTMVGSSASSSDGAVVVTGFPPNVASLWAHSYDPDAIPDAFPGDLAEGRSLPLNSVVFLWISALDGGGVPVVDLGSPAMVRMRIPETQWVDAVDLHPGNGVIDAPIYSMDYATGYWVREANGLLTDGAGAPIAEGESSSIRSGTYPGDVYAQFFADHFSWWNVDYPPEDCKPDFGDASDPPYPTTLAEDGARHLNICRAWLGAWVDGEDDANLEDVYDDGLRGSNPLKVRVSNFDWTGYLYLNALIDENADGDWADPGEWAIQNLPLSVPRFRGKVVDTNVIWAGDTWLRLTLTGTTIQNYKGTGGFAIGETEDYPFLKYRIYVGVLGNGTVTSDPPGISCRSTGRDCSAQFLVDSVVKLTATPDAGFRFTIWRLDCSGVATACNVRMDADHVVLATFDVELFRLTVSASGGGVVTSLPPGIQCRSASGCFADFKSGTSVDLTASPDPDWQVQRWGGDCSGTMPTCTVQMDRNRSVFANFTKTSYRLSLWVVGNGTVTSDSPGINCGSTTSDCSAEFPTGSFVNLTAMPEPGESFFGWGGDCSGSNATCTVRMDRDRAVSADFSQPTYRLFVWVAGNGTVTSDPPGIDCRWMSGTCSWEFATGSDVNLTATPDSGESFLGWSGDCYGSNATCAVRMDQDRSVYASFTSVSSYRLDVYVSSGNYSGPGGTVTSSPPGINCRDNCSAWFPAGINVTLTATPDAGWRFVQWYGDCTGTTPTCTLTMNGGKWVIAYFAKL